MYVLCTMLTLASSAMAQFFTGGCSIGGTPNAYEAELCQTHSNNLVAPAHYGNWAIPSVAIVEPVVLPAINDRLHIRGELVPRYYDLVPPFQIYQLFQDQDFYTFTVTGSSAFVRFNIRGGDPHPFSAQFVELRYAANVPLDDPSFGNWINTQTQFRAFGTASSTSCDDDDATRPVIELVPGWYLLRVYRNSNYSNTVVADAGAIPTNDTEMNERNTYIGNLMCGNPLSQYDLILERFGTEPPCSTAIPILTGPTFATHEYQGSAQTKAPDSPAQCLGPGDRPERWYSFQPVTSNSYIRVWGNGDFDAAVEVYDGCTGNLIACQNELGPGEREVVILPGLQIGHTYYYRTYHVGAGLPANSTFTTASAHIPFVWLSPGLCNANVSNGQWLTSTQPVSTFLLNARQWRFTETTPPFNSYEYIVNGTSNRINWNTFTQRQPGKSYTVEVRTRQYQGPHWGEYSNACVVHFPSSGIMPHTGEPEATGALGTLYPNPVQGNVAHLSWSEYSEATAGKVRILDLNGREVLQRDVSAEEMMLQSIQIYLPVQLANGIYLLVATDHGGTLLSKEKLVLSR